MYRTEIQTAERPVTVIDGEITHIESAGTGGVAVETLEEIKRAAGRLADIDDPFGGRYPSPAERAGIVPMAPLRPAVHVRHWGRALGMTSAGVMLAGAGAGVVAGTAAGPVGMVVGGIAGVVAGVVRGTYEQGQENGR